MTISEDDRVLRLDISFKSRLAQALFSCIRVPLERALGLNGLNKLYRRARAIHDDRHFSEKVLECLNVTWELSPQHVARIPTAGPAVVIANHPFGGIEGLILAGVLRSVRPDVKLIANYMLAALPEMNDLFFFVDPFGRSDSARTNVKPMMDAIRWVKNGGMLGVFPGGAVSHLSLRKREITDPPWSEAVARVIQKTEASVLPVFFHGSNGLLFNVLGLLHPLLRTARLPREFLKKQNSNILIKIGNPVPFDKLRKLETSADLMAHLRLRTYILGNRADKAGLAHEASPPDDTSGMTGHTAEPGVAGRCSTQPIVPPVDVDLLIDDIGILPPRHTLMESGEYSVLYANAWQIPNVLREIGRLREVTFRQANEGTGEAIDLDKFDDYYLHLFVWNKVKNEIVGAYRLGHTDRIVRKRGKEGLYTSTLFKYKTRLPRQICPALELGRSFVRPEYQKGYAPLMLLWKGIGAYVVRNPRYKILFGPVSINNQYHPTSRQLIAAFLRQNNDLPHLAKLVKPKNPLRRKRIRGWNHKANNTGIENINDIAALIADLETDQKDIPILLKQYLKLSGNMLGFNVDTTFGDVLDGLVLVDLTKVDLRMIERYLGKEGAATFLAYHRALQAQGETGVAAAR
ncbi:MAG: lysophospholipid acyltransferase family protein [Planctomycetes bacterium]|nr:lysophospholipid acyltransferase family protein [Planctomycetota bacterium]